MLRTEKAILTSQSYLVKAIRTERGHGGSANRPPDRLDALDQPGYGEVIELAAQRQLHPKAWRNPLAPIQQAIEILRLGVRCELCSRWLSTVAGPFPESNGFGDGEI